MQVMLGSHPEACYASILSSLCLIWGGCIEQFINRCMEHAMHLGSEKFVKGVSPTPRSAILRKVQSAFKNAKLGDTYDTDQLDAGLKGCENIAGADGDDGDDGEHDEDDDLDTGDACGKALALIKQVCFVPLRHSACCADFFLRYANLPKLKHFSIHVARRLKCPFYNFSYGLEHIGLPYSTF